MKRNKTTLPLSVITAALLAVFPAGSVYAHNHDHNDRIENNLRQIKDAVANINSHTSQLGELKNSISDNSQKIDANKKAIDGHTQQIKDTIANLNGQASQLGELKNGISSNSQKIDANKKTIDGQAQQIGHINTRSQANNRNIAANLQSINANRVAIERVRNQNTAQLKQLERKVNNLDKKVKRGFASQAALAGLFQPYNVGKLNVSAAVGGYQSETAVAIGSGYRFNEHFAAKAGVSLNTKGGDASYNVGFNFEW